MGDRRTFDGLAGMTHEARGLVAEVHVLPLEGPDGQEGPQDLVGEGTPRGTLLSQAKEVHCGSLIDLQDQKDLEPLGGSLNTDPSLHDGPVLSEGIVHPVQELELEAAKRRDPVGP